MARRGRTTAEETDVSLLGRIDILRKSRMSLPTNAPTGPEMLLRQVGMFRKGRYLEIRPAAGNRQD